MEEDVVSREFEGAGVVVTGSGQGVGKAVSELFLEAGANVAMLDLNEPRVTDAAAEIQGAGSGSAIPIGCDVSKADSVQAAIGKALSELGRIDVLINNAGAITMNLCVDLSEEEWDLNMDVNAKGVFLGTRAVLPHMLERGSGSIINTASEAGKMGMGYVSHYCAAKAAVIGFTRAVAREVAPHVRVNAVCPGTVNTPMMEVNYKREEELTGATREEQQEFLLSEIPMGRLQEPVHIARVMKFLCSDDASEMTGQAINVTGGKVQS